MSKATSEAFHALLKEMGELHDKKQADYGADGDPFANVRSAEEWGLAPSLGACIRIGDKVARLHSFYRKGELANESVEDAYLDLAVYAIIGLLLYREESAPDDVRPGALIRNGEAPKPFLAAEWRRAELKRREDAKAALFDQDKAVEPTPAEVFERATAIHATECKCGCPLPVSEGRWTQDALTALRRERGLE